jgi:hypothetical protein
MLTGLAPAISVVCRTWLLRSEVEMSKLVIDPSPLRVYPVLPAALVAKYYGDTPMLAVMRTVSPAKSTMVTRPGLVVPVVETTMANFCGWAAGPTGLIAVTTGR